MHVANYQSPYARLNSLPLGAVTLTSGFWKDRQTINCTTSIKEGYRKLQLHGNFDNLELANGSRKGEFRGPQFMDSDIYKWLEAAAYELERSMDTDLLKMVNDTVSLLESVQEPDGYLNSYWQYVKPGMRWTDLETGHELYCAGHMIEAAVALHRTTREVRFLGIALRAANNIVDTFGENLMQATGGHPEIELALVELYRETEDKRYLDTALFFVNQRGKKKMGDNKFHFGPEYFQDRVPVRKAEIVEGHAVRQLYLTSGITDIYMETGEKKLLKALERQWRDMTGNKMHITGGFGARHEGESFGDAYELPSERCYCETCASIAAIMWNWRMLLATGDARYADLIERCLYNGFLSGVSLDGSKFFYVNPLRSRGGVERVEWYDCACCPPNVMRLISMVDNYMTSVDDTGIYIHQYMSAKIHARPRKASAVSLNIETGYPLDENVRITFSLEKPGSWPLHLRIPAWCDTVILKVNGGEEREIHAPGTYLKLEQKWNDGDTVELRFVMQPVLMEADYRADDIRCSLAIEYGPLVYCVEEIDNPDADIDDISISPDIVPEPSTDEVMPGGIVPLRFPGKVFTRPEDPQPLYTRAGSTPPEVKDVKLKAVPYYAWANRGAGKMRVWIPGI